MAIKVDKHFKGREVPELEQLASEMVADGKTPNVFFVSLEGQVQLVTRDGAVAYALVQSYRRTRRKQEYSLEDRLNGCLVTNEPDDENSKRLVLIDNYDQFINEE